MQALQVIAYAGHRGEQEPRTLVIDGERLDVLGIDDRWYDQDGRYFKAAASDGRIYLIRCDARDSSWSLIRVWQLDA